MARSNLTLVFGAVLAGAVVIDYGVKNAKAAFASAGSGSSTSGASSTPVIGNAGGLPFLGVSNVSRLDQGIDVTAQGFVSPIAGTVLAAVQSASGWAGGGYVAVEDKADPNTVYYFAEGITPTVKAGQSVEVGQSVGVPRANPYNGVVGNIEFGRANPAAPLQPLAQVISNPAAMVENMYHWLLSLGLPAAGSTSLAGYP